MLLPYDPDSKTPVPEAGRILVPYAKYVELWNLAYPDKQLDAPAPPAPYALAGASYSVTLDAKDRLTLQGTMEIDLTAPGPVLVPLRLEGGVLAGAKLDGKPARLTVVQAADLPAPKPAANPAANAVAPGAPLLAVEVSGKNRHRLELEIRIRVERRGAWNAAEGVSRPPRRPRCRLPYRSRKPSSGWTGFPTAGNTRPSGRRSGSRPALSPTGQFSLQWRPKVAESPLDPTLTARSSAILDVQEDGLSVAWQIALEFRGSQRESFLLQVPSDCLLEKIEGENVRAWQLRSDGGRQRLEVSLLKPARDRESFTLRLRRAGAVGEASFADFDVPTIQVLDAALQSGQILIRRSPWLDLHTVQQLRVTRTDVDATAKPKAPGPAAGEDSPLGIRPYESYQFASVPFTIRLSASPVAHRANAAVQMILRLAEHQRTLESQVRLDVSGRPLYRVEIVLPQGLRLDQVSAPGEFDWALGPPADRQLLTVYLATGRQAQCLCSSAGRSKAPQPQARCPCRPSKSAAWSARTPNWPSKPIPPSRSRPKSWRTVKRSSATGCAVG